eukprot:1348899-Rhodomonas_salina.2
MPSTDALPHAPRLAKLSRTGSLTWQPSCSRNSGRIGTRQAAYLPSDRALRCLVLTARGATRLLGMRCSGLMQSRMLLEMATRHPVLSGPAVLLGAGGPLQTNGRRRHLQAHVSLRRDRQHGRPLGSVPHSLPHAICESCPDVACVLPGICVGEHQHSAGCIPPVVSHRDVCPVLTLWIALLGADRAHCRREGHHRDQGVAVCARARQSMPPTDTVARKLPTRSACRAQY